jgi:hypothetical protein
MIEQTPMEISTWNYHPPVKTIEADSKIISHTDFDVMRKRAATKKGIAMRFTCNFSLNGDPLLEVVGEQSYVIDLEDQVNKMELIRMIRNAFANFTEKFDFRKLGTVLADKTLNPLNESIIDLDTILPILD